MTHAKLTHSNSNRPDVDFRQGQLDTESTSALAEFYDTEGIRGAPLAYVKGRERERNIRGRVTAPRRSDATGENYLQALADYVILLERSVDQFQGQGYTITDDIRDTSKNCIYHRLEWTIQQGQAFEFEYDATATIGTGLMSDDDAEIPDVTPNTSLGAAAKVDGRLLPNMKQMTVTREMNIQSTSELFRQEAERNMIQPDSQIRTTVTYDGEITGTFTERANKDQDLRSRVDFPNKDFETRFPGYTLNGFVENYESDLDQSKGGNSHEYSLTFRVQSPLF